MLSPMAARQVRQRSAAAAQVAAEQRRRLYTKLIRITEQTLQQARRVRQVLAQLAALPGPRPSRPAAWERLGSHGEETPSKAYSRLQREMLDAEREVFRLARNSGRVPEEVLRAAQRDMDLEESLLARSDRDED